MTTDPVTTRINESVARRYVADWAEPEADEIEMPEDDATEPLPETLDLGLVLEEALALSIPPFPRAEGAEEIDLTAAPPGAAPIEGDEQVKPFAGLAALRARMTDED